MRLLPFRKRSSSGETLSAYVDGLLEGREREELEEVLAAEPALRDELEDLRSVKAMLASLEDVPAPRSFALQPVSVAEPRRMMMPAVSRMAFTVAGVGLLVTVFATYAMPAPQDETSLAVPAAGSERGQQDAAVATEPGDSSPQLLGTQVPPDSGVGDAGRTGDTAAVPPQTAEAAAVSEGADDGGQGAGGVTDELASGSEDKTGEEAATGRLPGVMESGDPETGRWRAAQLAGIVAAVAAALVGLAALRRSQWR